MDKRLSFKNKLLKDFEKLKNGKFNRDLFIDRYEPNELRSFLREESKNLSKNDITTIHKLIKSGEDWQREYHENLTDYVN